MEKVKLGDYTKIKTGKLDANASCDDGEFPFFTCSSKILKINEYAYDCECVLVAGNGDLNVKYYNGKFNAYQRTYIIESANPEVLNVRYLYYLINSKIEELRKNSIGGVIKYIKLNNLSDITFELIDLEEQIKIVNELDKVNHLIEINENQLEFLEELSKSKFVEMFGNPVSNELKWKVDTLNNLGTFKNGMNFNRQDKGFDIKFLGVGDFKKGIYIDDISLLEKVSLSEKPSEDYLLKNDDIVFVRSNGSKELVGRSTLLVNVNEELTYSGFCIRYRNVTKDINPKFLITLFQNKEFMDYLKKDSRGANINNINQQILSKLQIIIPPLDLQNKYVELVYKINKQKNNYENNFKKLKELKDNLMNKYFN